MISEIGKSFPDANINEATTGEKFQGKVLSKFAVLSDTHSDNEQTAKALAQAKALGASYVIHTGDWTTVGTIEELKAQKEVFDKSAPEYWGVLGDHDLWQSGTKNFEKVIGPSYQSFDKNGVKHILLDASDTDKGLPQAQLSWLKKTLDSDEDKITLIFMHLPPYHPYSSRTIWEKGGDNEKVKGQVKIFLGLIKGKVKAIFAGDHHFFESYTEPTSSVKIWVSGAVTRERNLQTPRFSLVEVYENGAVKVTDEVVN